MSTARAPANWWQLAVLALLWLWDWLSAHAGRGRRSGSAQGALEARGSRPRPPSTVSLVFAEHPPGAMSLQTVANLVAWCAELGLSYVWVYDPTGHLKQSRELLQSALAGTPAAAACTFHWRSGLQPRSSPAGGGSCGPSPGKLEGLPAVSGSQQHDLRANGHAGSLGAAVGGSGSGPGAGSGAVTVHLLGGDDAYAPALALAKQGAPLPCSSGSGGGGMDCKCGGARAGAGWEWQAQGCERGGSGKHQTHDAGGSGSDADILEALAAMAGQERHRPPELVLVVGPVLSLAGYPPAHTRSAELVHLGPSGAASRARLADAVAAYCSVLQRHGK